MKSKFFILVVVLAMALAATPVLADTIYFTTPNEALSAYTGTFATLDITMDGDGHAKFVLAAGTGYRKSDNAAVDFALMSGSGVLGLNVDAFTEGNSPLTLTILSYTGFCEENVPNPFSVAYAPPTGTGMNVDGMGNYNILINSDGNGFNDAFSTLIFYSTQTFTSVAEAMDLFDLNNKNYIAAVDIGAVLHPLSCSSTALDTGGVANGEPPDIPVPLPPSALLLGSGLLGLGLIGWRRREK